MKKILFSLIILLSTSYVFAQQSPVKWSYASNKTGANEFDLVFKAEIQKGWYVYSQYLESDEGPIATSFVFEDNSKASMVGKTKEDGKRHEGYDELFGMNIIKFSGEPVFTQRVKTTSSTFIKGYLTFMTCDDEKCLPPRDVEFVIELK